MPCNFVPVILNSSWPFARLYLNRSCPKHTMKSTRHPGSQTDSNNNNNNKKNLTPGLIGDRGL